MRAPETISGQRVLVVEDNDAIRSLLAVLLQRRGYDVVQVAHGEEALAAAADDFDVVLLDVGLPGMNGLEVCRRLRSQSATADIPIILLTGRAEPGDIRDGLAAGADDFLTKPFDEDELLMRLRRATFTTLKPRTF